MARLAEEAQRDWAFGWIELSGHTRLSEVEAQLAEKQGVCWGHRGSCYECVCRGMFTR